MSDSIVELLDEMYDEQSEKTSLGKVVERFEDAATLHAAILDLLQDNLAR